MERLATHSEDFFAEVILTANNLDTSNIDLMARTLANIRAVDGRLYVLGVGGSAGNASHAVNDFRKLCQIRAYAPTDNVSELTARTNDEGWPTVFSSWLELENLNAYDAILVLSVGGGKKTDNGFVSENIIKAVEFAKSRNAKVFGIVGSPDGVTAKEADVCVVIPNDYAAWRTPLSEAFQALVWHCLVSHPVLQKNATKW